MSRIVSRALAPLLGVAITACHATTGPLPTVGCNNVPAPASVAATRPSGTFVTRVGGLAGRPFGIRVAPGGLVFVTQQDANSVARVSLQDLSTRPPVGVGGDPGDVVVSHDGTTAYVSNFFDGSVHVLDAATGAVRRLLLVSTTNAYRLALAPDDTRLYVTSTDGALYSVDPTGVAPTTSVHLGGSLQGIALAQDGRTITVSSASGGLWRVNACTLAILASTGLNEYPLQDVVLSADETELYVANESGWVDVLAPSTLQTLRRIDMGALRPFGLAVTPDGAAMYVTSPGTGQVAILDPAAGVFSRTLPVGATPRRIAFDASGSTAVVSNEGNWVDVIR